MNCYELCLIASLPSFEYNFNCNDHDHESSDEDEGERKADDECDDPDDEERFARFVLRPKETSVQHQCSVSNKK